MRIVFDKNVSVGVRRFLSEHEVRTFVEMQWHPQLENGALLEAAEAAGFDAMVTSDQNIRYQQNLAERQIALVVLETNHWVTIRAAVSRVTEAMVAAESHSYVSIAFDRPPLRRKPFKPMKPDY